MNEATPSGSGGAAPNGAAAPGAAALVHLHDGLELFDSIHRKLLTLPGELEVYPAHFAGSACGAGISGKPSTTLAFERRFNPLLSLDRDAFIAAVADVPPKPAEIDAILRANRGRVQAVGS